ncbi:tetratricopeptide repeat protein [Paraburkholderia guartelaensis]|uniref:tetratricopeptide repeat protein n=1 Tax=Paraburkholderia guartelaensis TaxID=2546446 RepID=UPI002AB612EC|nr:tetratricopeptide repeat protein [Paraburkholderia guartelaensis]
MEPELADLPIEQSPDGSKRLGALGAMAEAMAERLHILGVSAYKEGVTHAASAAFALALRCRQDFSSFGDRGTLTILRHWGLALREDGDFQESLTVLRFVQEQLADVADSDFEALDNRNDIAVLLLDCGDFREAMNVLTPLIKANRRTRPSKGKDPQTLTSESNLADALKMAGDYKGALRLLLRVLRDRSESQDLGPDHADTLCSANNAAELLQRLGDLQGALRLQEHVLGRWRATMPDHTDTVTAAANLATTLYALGQFPQALALEREVLRKRIQNDGKSHLNTLIAANNLAGTLRDLGHFTEATHLLRRVVRNHGTSVREGNLHALMALTNLADLLREQGDLPAAGRLARRAWRLREQALSAEHPDTVTSMASYAAVLHGRTRYAQAIRLQRRILALRTRDDGPDNPQTLHAANDLASMLNKQGKFDEARILYKDIESKTAKVLGDDHPDTLEVRLSLAEVLYSTGKKDKSLKRANHVTGQILARQFLDARDFDRCARLAAMLLMLDAHEELEVLLVRVSSMMCETMELLNQDSSLHLLKGFIAFHDTWVRHCLTHKRSDILQALAPLHGLESAAWARADLDARARDKGARSEVHEHYTVARRQLHDARMQLTMLDADIRTISASISIGGRNNAAEKLRRSQLLARRKQVTIEEQGAVSALSAARDELRITEASLQAGQRSKPPSVADIRHQLAECEAVVLLVQFADQQVAAVTIRSSGLRVTPLPEVEALRETLTASERPRFQGARVDGLRGRVHEFVPTDSERLMTDRANDSLFEAFNLSGLEADIVATIWKPLASELSGVEKLHIVYAPTLRGLAMQVGCPITCTGYYAALPGFLRVFESTRASRGVCGGTSVTLDVGFDCAWATTVPIPFVQAEAALLNGVEVAARIQGGLEILDRLRRGNHASSVQLVCHGTTAGQGISRFAVLLVDAESGTRLDPSGLLSLQGTIDEFVCSTCVGGIVSQGVGVDAMGAVSAMQLKGVGSVVACLAPVSDFHMPILMALFRYHRRRGLAAANALDQAKRELKSGHWPAQIVTLVAPAYAEAMQQVLLRAQYAGPSTGDTLALADRAHRLARSIGAWVLPPSLEKDLGHAEVLSTDAHRAFSRKWCETSTAREQFSNVAALHLVETRNEWPALHRTLVDHLCIFTQCFGGVSA